MHEHRDDPAEDIGFRFQETTKYAPGRMPRGRLRPVAQPEPFKEYPAATAVVPLPPRRPEYRHDLWEVLERRRSRREFSGAPLPLFELAALLWAGQGVTAEMHGHRFRTAPSAGALYPVETYVFAHAVTDLASGIWHLNVRRWQLELIRAGDLGRELAEAALGQGMAAQASATFLWTAVVGRSAWKYAQRAYRYIYLDAAHIAAHVSLAAEALGLGCCAIAALYDDEVNRLLGVDGIEETILYMTSVGAAKS
jgi:SagB-type dehydrogenase family enzyme